MIIKWAVQVLTRFLESKLKQVDNDCVKQVIKWLKAGELDDAFKTDPMCAMLCVLEAMCAVGLVLLGEYRDCPHDVDHEPPLPIYVASTTAGTIAPADVADVLDLAEALGVEMPDRTVLTATLAPATIDPALVAVLIQLGKILFDWFRNRT
jgi:hypothetical protein